MGDGLALGCVSVYLWVREGYFVMRVLMSKSECEGEGLSSFKLISIGGVRYAEQTYRLSHLAGYVDITVTTKM